MKTIEKSMLVAFSDQQMFDLVQDVARYHEFLPWCEYSRIIQQIEHTITATLSINFHGLKLVFTTRNLSYAPTQIDIELKEGPFRHLKGQWQFIAIKADACKVMLHLEYAFANVVMDKLLSPLFGRLAEGLVDAFYQRAQQVYLSAQSPR